MDMWKVEEDHVFLDVWEKIKIKILKRIYISRRSPGLGKDWGEDEGDGKTGTTFYYKKFVVI